MRWIALSTLAIRAVSHNRVYLLDGIPNLFEYRIYIYHTPYNLSHPPSSSQQVKEMSSPQFLPFDVHTHRALHPHSILPPPPPHHQPQRQNQQQPLPSKPQLPQMQIPVQQQQLQSQMMLSSSPILYSHPSQIHDSQTQSNSSQFAALPSMPRLPPILQVEKQQVTTSATQAASASRRRNEAHFVCPVPGCGSTFTRRFNLRGAPSPSFVLRVRFLTRSSHTGHLRSHTEERPFVCEWPGCGKGFARQHDCK